MLHSYITENIDLKLTLRLTALILKISLINEEKYLKSQNLSKHGVENGVAMAMSDTLDAKFFQCLVLQ